MTQDDLAALEASWPRCDFWTLRRDPEMLTHKTVFDALELGDLSDAENAITWFLRFKATGALVVYGYSRKVVVDSDIDTMVERLTEAFHEHWTLEFGDPEADEHEEPEGLRAVIAADMRKRLVWQCDQTHQVGLTADAVAAMVVREWPRLARAMFEVEP